MATAISLSNSLPKTHEADTATDDPKGKADNSEFSFIDDDSASSLDDVEEQKIQVSQQTMENTKLIQ